MSRSVEIYEVSIYTILAISIHFSSISLDSIWPLNFPNFSLSLKFTFSLNFQSLDLLLSLVWFFLNLSSCIFISFDLKFGVFEKFWDLSNLLRFLQNFWDGFVFQMMSNHHTLHFISILTILSCILDVCYICCLVVCW